MRVRHGICCFVAMGLAIGQASAQAVNQTSFLFRKPAAPCNTCGTPVSGPVTIMPADPNSQPNAPQMPRATMPGETAPPTTPGAAPAMASPAAAPADAQAFAQAPAAGGEGGMSFNPAMFGDLGASSFAVVRGGSASTPTASRRAVLSRGSFKISDNESPRPTDRVFITYNYFNNVSNGAFDLHRELIGFEKTFLDGNASIGARLPFMQTSTGGVFGGSNHEIGDLTVIGKYAVINNCQTGNVLSGGIAVTVPTEDHRTYLSDGYSFRSVLLQPYAGWIFNAGNAFAHGFHSVVVPTDSREPTELNNDVGVGYWVFKSCDRTLRGVVPTVEGHLYTPLNHANLNNSALIAGPEAIVTITTGVNFVFTGNSTFGAAFAVPVSGPRPNNCEALVSFNFRF